MGLFDGKLIEFEDARIVARSGEITPSDAVRQLSIADITLSWPRLTWPALARRHAAPWPRKMSAISSDGRGTRAALKWAARPSRPYGRYAPAGS
jgi:hypothetical protein